MNRLASYVYFSDKTYELVSVAIDSMDVVVEEKRREHNLERKNNKAKMTRFQCKRSIKELHRHKMSNLRLNMVWETYHGRKIKVVQRKRRRGKKHVVEQAKDTVKKKANKKKDGDPSKPSYKKKEGEKPK